jgi:hypothetical protein
VVPPTKALVSWRWRYMSKRPETSAKVAWPERAALDSHSL